MRIGGPGKRLGSRAKSDQDLKLLDPSTIPTRMVRKTQNMTAVIGGRSHSQSNIA